MSSTAAVDVVIGVTNRTRLTMPRNIAPQLHSIACGGWATMEGLVSLILHVADWLKKFRVSEQIERAEKQD